MLYVRRNYILESKHTKMDSLRHPDFWPTEKMSQTSNEAQNRQMLKHCIFHFMETVQNSKVRQLIYYITFLTI